MEDKKKGQVFLKKSEECLFCQIISGKANLTRYSTAKRASRSWIPVRSFGHILLVSEEALQAPLRIPDDTVGILFNNVKTLTQALEKALDADGTLIAINDKVSQSKPHLHIHIFRESSRTGLGAYSGQGTDTKAKKK